MQQEGIFVMSVRRVPFVISDLNFRSDVSGDTTVPETTHGPLWCHVPEELTTRTLVRCQDSYGGRVDVDVAHPAYEIVIIQRIIDVDA